MIPAPVTLPGRPAHDTAEDRRRSRGIAEPRTIALVQAGLETRRIELPSGLVSYAVRRHPRSRGLRMTVDPRHGLVVSIPLATRRGWTAPETVDARVREFLRSHDSWIARHLRARERQRASARGGSGPGSRILYLGTWHRLRVEPAPAGRRRSFVERSGGEAEDELIVLVAPADRRSPGAVLEAWLRARARAAIDAAIDRHAGELRVRPAGVTLRDPRSRWGSASRAGRLMFSWRLVLGPPASLETVIVHELAHLRVFGHGPRFWALVAARRPEHLADRAWLRRHATELHLALDAGPAALDTGPAALEQVG